MAGSRAPEEDSDLDEVDAFNANREKVLLDEAGEYLDDSDEQEEEDEEVLALGGDEDEDDDDDDDEDEDDEEGEDEEGEEGEEAGWGRRLNYYGGDDVDDEDSKQMTEEALRQQKKHLQDLEMDDYIDEDMMEDWKKKAEDYDDSKSTNLKVLSEDSNKTLKDLDDDEKIKFLSTSFPEFVPLLKEFKKLNPELQVLKLKKQNELVEVKVVALSTYLGSIASYFALFVDGLRSGDSFFSMKESPVMESILSTREVWRQALELRDEAAEVQEAEQVEAHREENVLEDDVSEDDVSEDVSEEEKSEDDSEDISEEEKSEDVSGDVSVPGLDTSTKRTIKRVTNSNIHDFTEGAPDNVDMEEKQRRKRSLRFYTSKIDQAANKDQERFGGDVDLPYKERLFERQQRLIEEARKRGQNKNQGDDLDGEDFDADDQLVAQDINEANDEYYEKIKQGKQAKMAARRQAHELAVKAAKEGKLGELQDAMGEDGKRALNFQILKNKGLTPHRKNIDRNARVKKRKKYEKAQKKLKSVRQVYDGSNRGPYEGEKTGIKKGLSRSVKFN